MKIQLENNELIENVINSMADLLMTVNNEGIIQMVNQAALLLLGYKEHEMIGKPVRILTGQETFLSAEEFKTMLETKKLVEIEKEFVSKKGKKLTVLLSISILQGHSAAAVIVAKDISKRLEDEQKLQQYAAELEEKNKELENLTNSYKQVAENLKQSQKELIAANNFTNNIMDSMVDFVVVVDMDLTIRRVNPAALKLNGYEEHELIGQSVNMLMADRTFNEKGVELIRQLRSVQNLDKVNRRKDGRTIPISLSMSVLTDENGEDCGIVCVGKDVTPMVKAKADLEKTNERLRQSNRELEDFAYVASHDLQEPLRKVQAFGDRLQRKCADDLSDEGKDYIKRMRDAAGRMQKLINDLLTFSRVTSKAQPFQTVDVKEIAKEVISDLEVRIEQTNGKVEIGDLPVLDADPLQMRQLLQNLIGNALKFHRPDETPIIRIYSDAPTMTGGSFSIAGKEVQTVGNSNQVCKIIVQDNGIGFEEKYLNKIFTVFQRLHGRSEYEGSGIGLAVCRKIAERHGGSITAESVPNRGSTFLVTLPLTQTDKEINNEERH